MKFIHTLAILGLFALAGTASATCNNGATNWPKCDNQPKPPTTTPDKPSTWWNENRNTNTSTSEANSESSSTGVGVGVGIGQGGAGGAGGKGGTGYGGSATGGNAAGGNASQGQGQQQGIADSGNSQASTGAIGIGLDNASNSASGAYSGGNTLTGGSTRSESGVTGSGNGSASADNSGGNSAVSIDASDKSTSNTSFRDETLFIPAVVPSSPGAVVGVGNVISVTGTCGPLQTVIREQITGTYVGLIKRSTIAQGFNETLAPYTEGGQVVSYRAELQADGSSKFFGHQPVLLSTVVAVGAGRNLAIGGGSGRDWGQVGGGSSSSMTQLVTQVHLMPCEVQAQPRQVLVEVPVKTGRR